MSKNLISLITYEALPGLDPDDLLLKSSLEQKGYEVQALVWDDESVNWPLQGACVLRSTWDYHLKYDKFCRWINELAKTNLLLNQAEIVLWNSKKTYLKELAEAGLPVIPTVFIEKSTKESLAPILESRNWQQAVLKPAVGLASSGAKRVDRSNIDEAEAHLNTLLESGEAMLQEYLPSVEGIGERALSFINGKYSHCIRKTAFQKLAVAGGAGEAAVGASDLEIKTAERILAYLGKNLLYARVDLAYSQDNEPLLMELELVEPSLFLKTCPESAEKFADAIVEAITEINLQHA